MLFATAVIAIGTGYRNFLESGFSITREGFEILTYLGSPILIWSLFLLNRENTRPRHWHIAPIMIYPFLYFVLNMVVGHTVFQQVHQGSSALCPVCLLYHVPYPTYTGVFAYNAMNPAWWSSVTLFILVTIGTAIAIGATSFGLIWLKQKQIDNEPNNS